MNNRYPNSFIKRTGNLRRKIKFIFFYIPSIFFLLFSFLLELENASAHSPHDVIDALMLSPYYETDKTIFVAMSGHLRRSTDGGASWKELVNGLDNKTKFSSIAISPSFQVNGALFLASKGDGIYRSKDGGSSWSKINVGLDTLNIELLTVSSISDPKTILATGTDKGLYITDNEGESWHKILDAKITSIAFSAGVKNSQIFAGDLNGNLYFSENQGQTVNEIFVNSNWGALNAIEISPSVEKDKTFFIGTEKMGIFKTIDFGTTFLPVNNGLPNKAHIRSIAISPEFLFDNAIFATTWNEAVFSSTDAGNTWKLLKQGITSDKQANSTKYWSPHFRDLRIPKSFKKDKTIFLGGFDGLFRSLDGGKNWTQLETMPVSLIMGLDLYSGKNAELQAGITTYGGGAYTTTNNGNTWKINNTGLRTTRLSDISFSPNYNMDNTVFSASRGYLLKSTNKGDRWKRIPLSIQNWKTRIFSVMDRLKIPTGRLRSIILNPYEKRSPFATVITISPNFSQDKSMFIGTRQHGIFKSVDGGENYSVIWKANGKTVDALVISSDFSVDRTIFAGIRGIGVYKSTDGGDSWEPSYIVSSNSTQNYILGISSDYRSDQTLFVATEAGLYKTNDGGENWHLLKPTDYGENSYIITVALSPYYPSDKTLIISVKGKGLFKSEDGGTTFIAIARELIQNNVVFKWIKFSKAYTFDKTIYAASYENLFRTADGGLTWQLLKRPVRYENQRDVINYEGDWKLSQGEDYSATNSSYSDSAHAKAQLSFVGTGVSWIGSKSNDKGITRVYVDGNYMAEIDQFSAMPEMMIELYSINNLPLGPHEIIIQSTNNKNKNAKGSRIGVDAFDIAP